MSDRLVSLWESINEILSKWKDEGVQDPTPECKKLTKAVVQKLEFYYMLYPDCFDANTEEGITLTYRNGERSLVIIVDSYLQVLALVNDDKSKTIMKGTAVVDLNFYEIVKIFKESKWEII